jgi:sensor c-di-GMP phosphodiesterase-like protein
MRVDLEQQRFVPFYQPRVDLASGRVVGAEALARWIREDGTVVSPGEFIPLAEETGLILRLGEVMLDSVQRDLLGPLAPFREGLTVSFNASIQEILDPGFIDRLSQRVSEAGTAETMELELTESVIMDDIDSTMPVLKAIKDQGLSLAVDDFGTGYSSLYYLKRLPIDVLKIDKSFVDDIASDGNDQAIVTTIIAMGHALNLRLVAEGIETLEQRDFLTTHGCSEGQGYLYGKPMDRDTFVQFLETVRGAVR